MCAAQSQCCVAACVCASLHLHQTPSWSLALLRSVTHPQTTLLPLHAACELSLGWLLGHFARVDTITYGKSPTRHNHIRKHREVDNEALTPSNRLFQHPHARLAQNTTGGSQSRSMDGINSKRVNTKEGQAHRTRQCVLFFLYPCIAVHLAVPLSSWDRARNYPVSTIEASRLVPEGRQQRVSRGLSMYCNIICAHTNRLMCYPMTTGR